MWLSKLHVQKIAVAMLAITMVYSLKRYYSLATVDDLVWIIGPTAYLVGLIGQVDFIWDAGIGYISVREHAVIASSCGGVNFLIIAFSMLFFQGFIRLKKWYLLLTWLICALMAAYGVTIHINATRIVLSLALYNAEIYQGWFTPELNHRIMGVALYVTVLSLLFFSVENILDATSGKKPCTHQGFFMIAPLLFYFFFTLLMPILSKPAGLNRIEVLSHYGQVFSISIVVFSLLNLIRLIIRNSTAGNVATPLEKKGHEA